MDANARSLIARQGRSGLTMSQLGPYGLLAQVRAPMASTQPEIVQVIQADLLPKEKNNGENKTSEAKQEKSSGSSSAAEAPVEEQDAFWARYLQLRYPQIASSASESPE
mgnify:CR=1 FL=1